MDLIDLQKAHATQTTDKNGIKSEWVVYNEKREEIYRLPISWTEKQVMVAIHLGRNFELIAFNKGAEFQRSKAPEAMKVLQRMVTSLNEDRKRLIVENNKLANELDKLTLKLNNNDTSIN